MEYAENTVCCSNNTKEKAADKAAFKPLVYICSKYAGDVERNAEKAKGYCRFAVSKGALPIAMHLMLPQFMDDDNPKERELAMFINKIIQGKCDEVWVFTDREISSGMQAELAIAKTWHQKVRWFNEKCEEVEHV